MNTARKNPDPNRDEPVPIEIFLTTDQSAETPRQKKGYGMGIDVESHGEAHAHGLHIRAMIQLHRFEGGADLLISEVVLRTADHDEVLRWMEMIKHLSLRAIHPMTSNVPEEVILRVDDPPPHKAR